MTTSTTRRPYSRLGDDDLYLFNEGSHRRLADRLGAHPLVTKTTQRKKAGFSFGAWAPNATAVKVIGDFNGWNGNETPLQPRGSSGIWEGTATNAKPGHIYKYEITTRNGLVLEKADPFAFRTERPPQTGSVLWDLEYTWDDADWMASRGRRSSLDAPMSIYELHLGSWRRDPERSSEPLGYRELAQPLIDYVTSCGFTHVEFMPVMEHPFYGSWGYQVTSYFAPSARQGTPQDLMFLIDQLHQADIGVIIDWVPSHFPGDSFALAGFDGTNLFEHEDPRLGFHPDWGSLIFNYDRHEVRSFLASSADHWLRAFHADGLRVDAVASMLYRDYSRQPDEWLPNKYGGRENLEAVDFLKALNAGVYADHPDVQMIAEESTAWPGVSRPVDAGGLGFGFKWDMGWMHDTLSYLERDPIHRRHHHGEITFRAVYAFTENYVLPLSHDEVTHGKGSLLGKMPGDEWQRFANLRLLLGYQYTQPGKKLLFMGGEFAQLREWAHEQSLDWDLLAEPAHAGMLRWVSDLNRLYRFEPALHQRDCDSDGFRWVQYDNAEASTISYLRRAADGSAVLVALNLTPIPRYQHVLGVPVGGRWSELLNSDSEAYGGSGVGNLGGVIATDEEWGGFPHRVEVTLPPLAVVAFKAAG